MRLFTDVDRNLEGPKERNMSNFEYLNKSDRESAKKVRRITEQWFDNYPEGEDKRDLRSRFRKNESSDHFGAFYELFNYQLISSLGCEIESIHPSLGNTTSRPEFLIEHDGREEIFEAKVCMAESEEKMSKKKRKRQFLDYIDKNVDNRNFFIGISSEGSLSRTVSAKEAVDFIEEKLNELDPDQIAERYRNAGRKGVPTWTYSPKQEDFNLSIRPIPIKKSKRGQHKRAIGMEGPGKAFWVDSHLKLKEAIEEKAGKYGNSENIEYPYVLGVNMLSSFLNFNTIMEALFGEIEPCFPEGDLSGYTCSNEISGVWIGPDGPQNTHMSAALIGRHIDPWRFNNSFLVLIHNPWAKHPYEGPLTRLTQGKVQNGEMIWEEGEDLEEIMQIPVFESESD